MGSRSKTTDEIFVTGFPRLVASKTIEHYLLNTQSVVHVLVHAQDVATASHIKQSLKKKSLERRVRLYIGDVTALDLGLSGEEYNLLCSSVNQIHHFAGIQDFGLPERMYHNLHVTGTKNLLDFAEDCSGLTRFHYYGTINVHGRRTGVIRETDLLDSQTGFFNELEHSRFRAERLVRERMPRLPATIYRLGWVVGDSRTGFMTHFEGVARFIQLLLTLDRSLPLFLPGPCQGNMNFVPVDYLIDAAAFLAMQPNSLGQTYHLTDPFPLPARTVIEMICNYLGRKAPTFGVPRRLYKLVRFIPGSERLSSIPYEVFDAFNHKAVFNCAQTLNELKGTELSCPRFESYFPMTLEFAQDLLKRRSEQAEERNLHDPLDSMLGS